MESTKKYFLLSILLLLFYAGIAEASIFIDKTKDFKNLDSGQLTLIIYSTDPLTNTIQYTYDALNRLVLKTYPDASTTTYQYDAIGNLTSASNAYISYSFAYDALGRMTSVTDSLGKSISYVYDANSNRTSMTSPIGTTSYVYNALNQLTQLVQGTKTFGFVYDSLGRRTSLSMPNGTTTSYSYDNLSRITNLSTLNSQLQSINSNIYTYDSVGNKLTKQDPTGTHNYSYDNTYQLTQATHPSIPTEAFAYDAVGNRTTTTVDAANKLLQDSNATYQYDANGNRYIKTQSDGTIIYYSYDYEGRLTRVETQKPGLTTVAVYKYDALGRRFEKAVTENSVTTTTRYLYDGLNILAEYDENNNVKAQYIHNLGIDDQLAMIKNGQTYYYHKDGLGSITKISDSTGSVVQSYEYDSFGNITNQTGSLIQPFMFTGREYDSESGLYFYRARELDSKTGTFTQKDPIGFGAGDTNLYRYVFNSPVNYTDPLGLFNPTKAISSFLNAVNSGRLYASGTVKLAASAGFDLTGVGVPAGIGTALLGGLNIYSGTAAQKRAMQQWDEALKEKWSDATWRNLLGVLPFGQEFDDPCESTPGEFLKQQINRIKSNPSGILEILKEYGALLF